MNTLVELMHAVSCILHDIGEVRGLDVQAEDLATRVTALNPSIPVGPADLENGVWVPNTSSSVVDLRDTLVSGCMFLHAALLRLHLRLRAIAMSLASLEESDEVVEVYYERNNTNPLTIVELRDAWRSCCSKAATSIISAAEKVDDITARVTVLEEQGQTFENFNIALTSFNSDRTDVVLQVTMFDLDGELEDGAEITQWGPSSHTELLNGVAGKMYKRSSGGYNNDSYIHIPRYTVLHLDTAVEGITTGFSLVFTMRSTIDADRLYEPASGVVRFAVRDPDNGYYHFASSLTNTIAFRVPFGYTPSSFNTPLNTRMTLGSWGAYAVVLTIEATDAVISFFKNGMLLTRRRMYDARRIIDAEGGISPMQNIMINGDPNSAYTGGVNLSLSNMYSVTSTDVSAFSIYNTPISDAQATRLTSSVYSEPDPPGFGDNDWSSPAVAPSIDLSATDVTDGPVAAWGPLQQSDASLRPVKSGGAVVFAAQSLLLAQIPLANANGDLTVGIRFRQNNGVSLDTSPVLIGIRFQRVADGQPMIYSLSMYKHEDTPCMIESKYGLLWSPMASTISFVDSSSWHTVVYILNRRDRYGRLWHDGNDYLIDPQMYYDVPTFDTDMNDAEITIGGGYDVKALKVFPGKIPTSSMQALIEDLES